MIRIWGAWCRVVAPILTSVFLLSVISVALSMDSPPLRKSPEVPEEGDIPSCVVSVGDPLISVETGVPIQTDQILGAGVLVDEDKVLVPLLAVTEKGLRIESGKDYMTPLVEGDYLLESGISSGRRPVTAVEGVPIHVWDADSKKTRTMEGKLIGSDLWHVLALYQLPDHFPGRSAVLYDGDAYDRLRVICYPYTSISLKEGPTLGPSYTIVGYLNTAAVSQQDAGDGWGILFQYAYPARGAGVYNGKKLAGIVSEYTHGLIERSPSHSKARMPATYVILASRIREFLKEQGVR